MESVREQGRHLIEKRSQKTCASHDLSRGLEDPARANRPRGDTAVARLIALPKL
jgi:hypothetical protein